MEYCWFLKNDDSNMQMQILKLKEKGFKDKDISIILSTFITYRGLSKLEK